MTFFIAIIARDFTNFFIIDLFFIFIQNLDGIGYTSKRLIIFIPFFLEFLLFFFYKTIPKTQVF